MCLAGVLLGLTSATGQDITSHKWGFDNTVVADRFNLLTVEVQNNTPAPFDKVLVLRKQNIGGRALGAPIEKRCYLGPSSRRIIQFAPYISDGSQGWSLEWKAGDAKGANLFSPGLGVDATVILAPEPNTVMKRPKLPFFPPEQLPNSAHLMDGLRAVVLSGEPDLTPSQRTAFFDWLRRGGIIHILQVDKAWPEFSSEFDVLTLTEAAATYSNGRIYRHEYGLAELTKKEVLAELRGRTLRRFTPPDISLPSQMRSTVLTIDRDLDYGWGIIFSLAVVYLVLIGPVFYRLSSRSLSWPISLALLAAIIGASTWIFMVIGARGGEVSKSKSWMYARLAGSEYEVTRYSLVFVTAGGDYEFSDGDNEGFYSSAQFQEFISGRITNGPKARYTVDMPRNSQRLVIHKNRVPGPDPGLAFDGGEVFRCALPLNGTVFCVNDRRLHTFKGGNGVWRMTNTQQLQQFADFDHSSGREIGLGEVVLDRLHVRSLDLTKPVTASNHYVFFGMTETGDAPESFRPRGKGPSLDLGADEGRAVFRFDFYVDR